MDAFRSLGFNMDSTGTILLPEKALDEGVAAMAITRKSASDDDFAVHDTTEPGADARARVVSAATIQAAPPFGAERSVSDGVALVSGRSQSFAGEIRDLRRDRLCAAAMFLAVVYAVLFVWNWVIPYEDFRFVWVTMAMRCDVVMSIQARIHQPNTALISAATSGTFSSNAK